ncbi:MAG: hypothetical protein WKF78_02120 [Candidatus Limnocylindrales bacterium]
MRGSTAEGFELDIITMVLLGGVSIFGGSRHDGGRHPVHPADPQPAQRPGPGSTSRGNTQTGVIGVLLILSVLVPNLASSARTRWRRSRGGGGGPGAGRLPDRSIRAESVAFLPLVRVPSPEPSPGAGEA